MPDDQDILLHALLKAVELHGARMAKEAGIKRSDDRRGDERAGRGQTPEILEGTGFGAGFDGTNTVLPFTADVSFANGSDICVA